MDRFRRKYNNNTRFLNLINFKKLFSFLEKTLDKIAYVHYNIYKQTGSHPFFHVVSEHEKTPREGSNFP